MKDLQKQFAPVEEFLRKSGNFVPSSEGDYLADTFHAAKLVALSTAISGNKDPLDIAAFTSLPAGFTGMVLQLMDKLGLWERENSVRLLRTLKEGPENLAGIENLVDAVVEDLWMEAPSLGINDYLGERRRGILPGGGHGTYPPPEPDEFHELGLKTIYLGYR